MSQVPFCAGAYMDSSIAYDAQRSVNLFLEQGNNDNSRGPLSKNINKLVGTPGTKVWQALTDTTGAGIRALYVCSVQNILVVVIGSSVWCIDSANNKVKINGLIGTNTGPLSISDNGFQCAIADGNAWYFNIPPSPLNLAVTTTIVSLNAKASTVNFNDTFLLFQTPDSPVFYSTGNDNVTLNPLDYASLESYPQNITAMAVMNGYIWIFGSTRSEIWVDSGNPLFSFTRVPGTIVEAGCINAYVVSELSNCLVWLGGDLRGSPIVYQSSGFSFQRISTHAMEEIFASYDYSAAYSSSYMQNGHWFYVINFPNDAATWVWDQTTALWHERAYNNPITGLEECALPSCYAAFNGQIIVGDRRNNYLYILDTKTYTDGANADPIIRIRSTPHYFELDNYQRMYWQSLQIDMQVGVATQTGQGEFPVALLDISNDGGFTWSFQRQATIGAVGNYRTRVIFWRLGQSRNRVFRLTISDPVDVQIFGASARERVGAS